MIEKAESFLKTKDIIFNFSEMLYLQDLPLVPPWTSESIKYLTNKFEKEDPFNYIRFNHLMVTEYKEHSMVYTDGSKNNEDAAAAFVILTLKKTEIVKLDPSQFIFQAEFFASRKAGNYLTLVSSENAKILICSNSKSAI